MRRAPEKRGQHPSSGPFHQAGGYRQAGGEAPLPGQRQLPDQSYPPGKRPGRDEKAGPEIRLCPGVQPHHRRPRRGPHRGGLPPGQGGGGGGGLCRADGHLRVGRLRPGASQAARQPGPSHPAAGPDQPEPGGGPLRRGSHGDALGKRGKGHPEHVPGRAGRGRRRRGPAPGGDQPFRQAGGDLPPDQQRRPLRRLLPRGAPHRGVPGEHLRGLPLFRHRQEGSALPLRPRPQLH